MRFLRRNVVEVLLALEEVIVGFDAWEDTTEALVLLLVLLFEDGGGIDDETLLELTDLSSVGFVSFKLSALLPIPSPMPRPKFPVIRSSSKTNSNRLRNSS